MVALVGVAAHFSSARGGGLHPGIGPNTGGGGVGQMPPRADIRSAGEKLNQAVVAI